MARNDEVDRKARELAAALPRNTWIIKGTDSGEPYPCRCPERLYRTCSAAWCPCAGRSDPQEPDCCGFRFSPADVVMAKAAWELKKRQEEEPL